MMGSGEGGEKRRHSAAVRGVNANARPEIVQSRITQHEIDVKGTWLANATFPQAVKLLEAECLSFRN